MRPKEKPLIERAFEKYYGGASLRLPEASIILEEVFHLRVPVHTIRSLINRGHLQATSLLKGSPALIKPSDLKLLAEKLKNEK